MTLAELQVDALRVPADSLDPEALSGPRAFALAESRGFTVLGRGSSRIAVERGGGTVAKVAHSLIGLELNLHEMAFWLSAPGGVREHLTPCLELTPELVLVQRRVEVCGPPLRGDGWDPEAVGRSLEARMMFADRIFACRRALGLGESDPQGLRPDNFGVLDGRVVAIDFGDQFPPLWRVWARLLDLDSVADLSLRSLAVRAGLNVENTEACPCFCGGTFAEGGEGCAMDTEVAEFYPDDVPMAATAESRATDWTAA